jgi:hypothetical protein
MMGYHESDSMCRVDFFTQSGKWKYTEAVDWTGFYDVPLIHNAFQGALDRHLAGRMKGLNAVCIKPYHVHAHPIMLAV